eukprot:CAMPEP_0113309792 /NCGR_PEP_ID=MMETSP0010_2-20120614/7691_1 /TAXON_ID=216773 ORGANISM="Corethron hystrix, Strain 308" /NCGR_SAMPLE_ID=MMETSP0010_2 /ASSEMBLY_ACC=CAM_ASM_000155 /LENGTH=233 /DNA_ID=CAMNT_0000165109 /DNA_START=11 /DNA_END=709 /DNA_ORIENTATION=- /assembly_acc=CAM_ASM_000155
MALALSWTTILISCLLSFRNHGANAFAQFDAVFSCRKTKVKAKTVMNMASPIGDSVFECVRLYKSAAAHNGLLTDMLTCCSIYTSSDLIAQMLNKKEKEKEAKDEYEFFEKIIVKEESKDNDQLSNSSWSSSTGIINSSYDSMRTFRLASFGLVDGAISHAWFLALDSLVGEGQGLADTLLKTLGDALVYTPLWCAWFLAFMTTTEPSKNILGENDSIASRIQSIPKIWGTDW